MEKKKYYKKIFNYFKKEKKHIIIYVILSLLIVVINTIFPTLSAKSLTAITHTNLDDMLKYAILILLVGIIDRIVVLFNGIVSKKIQDTVELEIKEDVSKELFNLEIKNFDKEGTGFFANRIEGEPRVLAGIFSRIRYSFAESLSSLGTFIYIFVLNYVIGIFLLITAILQFLIYMKRTKLWEEERKKN